MDTVSKLTILKQLANANGMREDDAKILSRCNSWGDVFESPIFINVVDFAAFNSLLPPMVEGLYYEYTKKLDDIWRIETITRENFQSIIKKLAPVREAALMRFRDECRKLARVDSAS